MIDVAAAIRSALIADSTIAAALPAFKGSKTVFTRRPVDASASYPMIIISPDVAVSDADMIDQQAPVIVRDIAVYGQNADAARYVAVEAIAARIRDIFHRSRRSITVSGWRVTDIIASGPVPAPTGDDDLVGRVVTLTIRATPA